MTMTRVGGTLLFFSVCMLALAGCGTEPAASPTVASVEVVDHGPGHLDKHRTLGDPIQAGNLTVWPVYTDNPIDIGEFLTLQEAEARKVAVVRELGPVGGQNRIVMNDNGQQVDAPIEEQEERTPLQQELDLRMNDQQLPSGDAAEVGRVVIENKGELPILVVAGTIIDGGNQDRQIGQDFVIAAGDTVDVDAYCVEHGRWGQEETTASVTEFNGMQFQFSASRAATIAPKVVRAAGQYGNDQGKVWQEVALSNRELGTQNATDTLMGAIDEVDEKTKAARATYEKTIGDAFEALAMRENAPVGFAYAINGKPVTVRAFAHERILRSQLPLFVKTMAIEAQMVAEAKEATARCSADDMIAMVRGIQAARNARTVNTRASNQNVYFSNDVGFNGSCRLSGEALRRFTNSVGPDMVVVTEDWTAK